MQRTRNRTVVLAFLLVMTLVVAACGSNAEEPSTATGAGGAQAAGSGEPTSFDVVLTEFATTPDAISAPEGKDLTFNVKNEGQAPHTFAIEAGEKTFITPTIEAGASATLDVTALGAGDYKIICTVPGHEQAGMVGNLTVGSAAAATGGTAGMDHANMSVGEMLAGHEQGVNDFVTNVTEPITEGIGAQPLKPTTDGKTKVFAITVDETDWEVAPGDVRQVMSYNGTVPGPEIRVFPGDRVRFEIQNDLEEPTTMHWHGLTVPNDQDGTPYITQDPIMPGEAYTYEFTIRDHPGLYMYHSHFNSTAQVEQGLYGPIVIQGRGKDAVPNDEEFTMVLGDGPLGFNINGKGFRRRRPSLRPRGTRC